MIDTHYVASTLILCLIIHVIVNLIVIKYLFQVILKNLFAMGILFLGVILLMEINDK